MTRIIRAPIDWSEVEGRAAEYEHFVGELAKMHDEMDEGPWRARLRELLGLGTQMCEECGADVFAVHPVERYGACYQVCRLCSEEH